MKFHKIIRESLALHLADKSAVCAINRHLRFSQECANAPLSTMNVKKSFTLVQVYSSPFYAPTCGADSSRSAQCIGHCGAAPTPSCVFSLHFFDVDWSPSPAHGKGHPSA